MTPLVVDTFRRLADGLDALYILHFYGVQRDIEWPGSFSPNTVRRATTGEKDKGEMILSVCLITSESPFQIPFISTLIDASFYL